MNFKKIALFVLIFIANYSVAFSLANSCDITFYNDITENHAVIVEVKKFVRSLSSNFENILVFMSWSHEQEGYDVELTDTLHSHDDYYYLIFRDKKVFSPDDLGFDDSFLAYPNPVHHTLYISAGNLSPDNIDVVIYNRTGQIVKQTKTINWDGEKHQIGISNLSSGMYFVQFQSENLNEVMKVVKQ